jgi:hypothetical protein
MPYETGTPETTPMNDTDAQPRCSSVLNVWKKNRKKTLSALKKEKRGMTTDEKKRVTSYFFGQ